MSAVEPKPTANGKWRVRTYVDGKRIQVTRDSLKEIEQWVASVQKELQKPVAAGSIPEPKREKLHGSRFVFTSAQNNTFVHADFLAALELYCKVNNAQLIVSPFTYNKNGFQNSQKDDDELWYDPKIIKYMRKSSLEVTEGLVFCGELDILPTAVTPLSGLSNYAGVASGIVPHAKVQMVSLPRMPGDPPRFMYTTGAVTQRNYIQRKAGQKAEFHHVFGALLVEIDKEGDWFARQLIADQSGTFHDMENEYTAKSVTNKPVTAINWGDIHAELSDPAVAEASWLRFDSMLEVLQPKYQLVHDVTDFTARNHHNINDPYFLATTHFNGKSSVKAGMRDTARVLEQMATRAPQDGGVIVVDSNHDQAFTRWLRDGDVRRDPANASYWHTYNAEIYKNIEMNRPYNVFEKAVRDVMVISVPNVLFLTENDSFKIGKGKDIECGMHGHRGPNGARGTTKAFRTLGSKVNMGHTHSASIIDGVYTAGTASLLDMGYNKGPTSWSHSHIVTYQNGKRAIITLKPSATGRMKYRSEP